MAIDETDLAGGADIGHLQVRDVRQGGHVLGEPPEKLSDSVARSPRVRVSRSIEAVNVAAVARFPIPSQVTRQSGSAHSHPRWRVFVVRHLFSNPNI